MRQARVEKLQTGARGFVQIDVEMHERKSSVRERGGSGGEQALIEANVEPGQVGPHAFDLAAEISSGES